MIVSVEFEGTPHKKYWFNTNLDLMAGGIYEIVADNKTTYDNRVRIIDIFNGYKKKEFRTITSAKLLVAPKKPDKAYDKIYVNPRKDTVCVVWKDGTRTVMKPQEGDVFDYEKGIAMCFLKKIYNNRGCFNDVFRDIEVV